MMKFFRKYNKQLLAFFMAALMIVFIGGSALEGMLRPDPNPQIATSNLGPIMLKDQHRASEETRLLESVGRTWNRPLFSDAPPLQAVDWILLSREATKLGIDIDMASVETSPEFQSQLPQIDTAARQLRVKRELIISALARLNSIREAAVAVSSSSIPSEAEVVRTARDVLEKVRIRAVLLPAEAFVKETTEFTEAELNEQFTAHRERERGPGLEFGYYQPPAIRVQYFKIDRGAIAAAVGVPNLERKAKTYYEERREKDFVFRRKTEELTAPDPAEQGLIVGPPGPKPTFYIDWEQAKPIAIEEVRKQYADEFMQRVVDWIIPLTSEAWVDAVRRDNGYKTPPEAAASVEYYERMLDRLPQTLKLPGALTVHVTDFFSQGEASKVPDIGGTIVKGEEGLVARNFASLAFRNEAIVPQVPQDEPGASTDYLALFQTSPLPLTDVTSGNMYAFRVVESRPGGPPKSLDEVREQVIADLRLKQGYESAKKRAGSLQACAAIDPLRDAYEADPDLAVFRETGEGAKTGYFEPAPFTRLARTSASKGRPPEGTFVGGGLGRLPNEVVDACFALADAPQKSKVLEVPSRAAVLIVEWVETIPAGEDEFNGMRKQLVTQLSDERWRQFVSDWLDPDKIRARTGFALTQTR